MVKNIIKLCFGIFSLCVIIVLLFTESIYTYAEYTNLVRENLINEGDINSFGESFFLKEYYYSLFIGEKLYLKMLESEPGSWNSYEVPKTTEVSWSSMDKSIASVNKKGVVTAKKAGYTYIVANVEGAKVVCEITVVEPYLDYTSVGLGKGDSKQIKLIGSKAVSFDSSDKNIAVVDSYGIVTGKKYGTATVTVKDTNKKVYECKVNVTKDVSFVRNNELTVVYEDGNTEVFDVSKKKVTIKEHAKTVMFGIYPQTLVSDSELTNEIMDAKYDRDGNAVVDGIVYKRITRWDSYYADKAWPKADIESSRNNNNSQLEEGLTPDVDDVYWAEHEFAYFRYEPIKWDVLSITGGKSPRMLLMTHDVIDKKPYGGNTWEKSPCRVFLNGEFLDVAFSEEEKKTILPVTNKNNVYIRKRNNQTGELTWVIQTKDDDTKDRCYLLSIEDMSKEEYGFCESLSEDNYTRRSSLSQYASTLGVSTSGYIYRTTSGCPMYRLTEERKKTAAYMLRSRINSGSEDFPEMGDHFVIDPTGGYNIYQAWLSYDEFSGIRPVINVDVIIEGTIENNKKNSEKINIEQRGGKNTLTVKYKDGNWQSFNLKTDALKFESEVEKVYFGRCFDTRCYIDEDDEDDVDWKEVDWKEVDTDPLFEGHKYVADVSGKKYLKIEGSEEGWQNGAWCCDSPIEWIPLKVEKKDGQKRILLMAKNIVEGCYGTNDDEKWESSKKRSVLNGLFYEYAFTKQERKFIGTNEIIDSKGKSIRDKVFILSPEEATNPEYGFSSDYRDEDYARRAGITSYVMWSYSGMFDWGYCTEDGSIAHFWHLRPTEEDPKNYGTYDNTDIAVFTDGAISGQPWCGVGFLRPVIWLKIEG